MNFDSWQNLLDDLPTHDDEWALYQLFTRVIFDTLVRDIVREQYDFRHASRATLHLQNDEATLFVRDGRRTYIHQDKTLHEWALNFLAGDVLNLPVEDITTIYLDGMIGAGEPYLYIAGSGVLVATGEPISKGKLI